MTLTNSTVTGNSSYDWGGGIHNVGTMTVTDTTVSGNSAGSFFYGSGGGIFNSGPGTMTLTDSTVSTNDAADQGGGIANEGTLTLTNSTVSGNKGTFDGGGILNDGGSATLTNSTVSFNSTNVLAVVGAGVYNDVGKVELVNTVVANNHLLVGGDCRGSITSLGHNLDSDGTCNLTEPTDVTSTDPLLGPLQDNGGPTETHALLLGSLAIDAGDDASAPLTDQRGVTRPQGAASDIGAYEFVPADFTVNSKADTDDGSCDPLSAGDCTLREAINAANANAGLETIAFEIPGAGPHTSQLGLGLPKITDPVIIDGYTQPGASPNTNGQGLGSNAVLKIELDGSNAGATATGLILLAGNSTVRGLVINRFLNPNPPKDTDGRREDSGRGWVRELQGRWPGVLG